MEEDLLYSNDDDDEAGGPFTPAVTHGMLLEGGVNFVLLEGNTSIILLEGG